MATEINCKDIAEKIEAEAREMAAKFEAKTSRKPKLVTLIANDDPASERYVRNKMRACDRCGIAHEEHVYMGNPKEFGWVRLFNNELDWSLCHFSNRSDTEGVMLQLPVYDWWNANELIQLIDPSKDVDCLTAQNMGKLALGDNSFMPATVAGIMRLFKEEGYDLTGKTVVIRGRSNIVGKPLALAMINAGATVISENSHSSSIIKDCFHESRYNVPNVIIDATGKEACWNPDCDYYIDVTTIVGKDGKLHGSVKDYDSFRKFTKYTPVPRGVGLLTCACLAWNTAYLACKQIGIEVDYDLA